MKKFFVLGCFCSTLSLSGMIATYKGVQAFNNNDLQTAQKHFDTVLTDNPHHAQTLYNLGKIAYKQEQFDQAQAYFEKALQAPNISDQLSEQAHYDNGTSYVKLQEWQKALEQFEEVVKKNPNHEYAKKMIEQLKEKIEEEREKEKQQQDQDTNDDDQKNQQEESQKQDQSNNKDQSDSDKSHDEQNSEDSDSSEDNNEDSDTNEQKQEGEEQKSQKNESNESSDKQNQSQNIDNKKDQQSNQQSYDNKQDKQQQSESQQTQQAQQQEKGDQEEKMAELGTLDQTSQQKDKEKIDVQTLLLQEAERNDAYYVKQLLQQQLKNETVQHGTKNW